MNHQATSETCCINTFKGTITPLPNWSLSLTYLMNHEQSRHFYKPVLLAHTYIGTITPSPNCYLSPTCFIYHTLCFYEQSVEETITPSPICSISPDYYLYHRLCLHKQSHHVPTTCPFSIGTITPSHKPILFVHMHIGTITQYPPSWIQFTENNLNICAQYVTIIISFLPFTNPPIHRICTREF